MAESTNRPRANSTEPESMKMIRPPPPSSSPSRRSRSDGSAGISQHTFGKEHFQKAIHQSAAQAEEEAMNAGILASGLAWVQRQRERRRREYLQTQAELQLQKIMQAEQQRTQNQRPAGTTSETTATATTYPHIKGKYSEDTEDSDNAANLKVSSPRPSKSGEGATGHIDIADLAQEQDDDMYLTPKVRIQEEDTSSTRTPYILNEEQMHQIAIHVLPKTISFCKWRRLYGLARDGDSFERCLRTISNVQRTLLVVRTTKGAVFGGYADSSWQSKELGNNRFYGSAQACLFSCISGSDKLRVYKWTGKNRYIQLCDSSKKMFAFGGGGEDGAFGLCVEEDFQTGSTGPCDTFGNQPLCDQETFEIVDLEFWEFLTGVF